MISIRRMPALFRVAIMAAAIAALLGVAMASGTAAHFHSGSGGGQCDICMTAHVVSLEARGVFHHFGAVEARERLAPGAAVDGYQLLLAHSSFSRGPPSLSL